MKQISLLFIETSVFFFSSVNIFTSNYNNNNTTEINRIDFESINNNNNNNNKPNQNFIYDKRKTASDKFQNRLNYFNMPKGIEERSSSSNNNYITNQNMFPQFPIHKKIKEYNDNNYNNNYYQPQMPNNYNYAALPTENQFPNKMYNNNDVNHDTMNNTGETKYEYNTNKDENQEYYNNFTTKEPPTNRRQRRHSKLKEETINEIQLHNPKSKEETSDTKENNLIKYNVDDPKKQISGIRSSAYVTGYNNGRNNRKSCCGIKMKIEKNTVDMEKAKNNINNEIEKTIIEKFKNITFNIELKNEEVDDIRNLVFGDINKIISYNKKKGKKLKEGKKEKIKKKKNNKKSKEEKEKEDKDKIIAAKMSITESCIEKIKNNYENYFNYKKEVNSVICLFRKFKESLDVELADLQINDNKDKEILNNDNNIVTKIFEKHFDKEIENIITNNDSIRKEYEKYIKNSKFDELLGKLSDDKDEDRKDRYEKLLKAFSYIKNKTLIDSKEKKNNIEYFADNIKERLMENIIKKVIKKVSEEGKKEENKGIIVIENQDGGNIEQNKLKTKKN